jgi:hypothetical protein
VGKNSKTALVFPHVSNYDTARQNYKSLQNDQQVAIKYRFPLPFVADTIYYFLPRIMQRKLLSPFQKKSYWTKTFVTWKQIFFGLKFIKQARFYFLFSANGISLKKL